MKIVNIDVDGEIKLVNIFDTDNKTSQTINRAFRVPAGNYKNIILKFNFISPSAKQENLHLFAIFKTDYIEKAIEVEIANLEAEGEVYKNSCFIPSEVLQQKGIVKLGIYGYILDEDETLKKRLSLAPISHSVINGSFEEDVESPIIPTPTVFEVYFNKVKETNDKMEKNLSNYENKITTRFNEVESLLNDKLLFYKKYENVSYANSGTTEVAINIQEYSEACLLFVDINGLDLIKDVDYTLDSSLKKITLKKEITVDNTAIHFVCLKTTVATSKDYDALKGDKGEIGETGPRGPQGPKGDPADKTVVYKRATGNSVKLDECSDTYKFRKINVLGDMKQDVRQGYNKIFYPYSLLNLTNTTVINNTDNDLTVQNNTANQSSWFFINNIKLEKDVTYTISRIYQVLSGTKTDETAQIELYLGDTWKKVLLYQSSSINKFTVDTNGTYRICIKNGTSTDILKIKYSNLMILKGEYTIETLPKYEQYGAKPSLDYPSEVEGTTGNVENKIQNKNYYNINDKIVSHFGSDLKIDDEDWISVDVDNSSGTSTKFIDFWLKPNIILQPNKDYYVVLEIKKLNGKYLEIRPIDNFGNISQFDGVFRVYSQDLKAGDVLIKKIKTLSDFSKVETLNRGYISLNAGLKASATFRISILAEEVTASNFVYTPYKEQIYQLPLGNRTLYGDSTARDCFKVTIDENLYRKTGNKKITELKLVKNWEKVILDGTNNKFIDKSGTTKNNMFKYTGKTSTILKASTNNDTVLSYSNYFLGKYSANYLYNNNLEGIGIENTGSILIAFSTNKNITTVELANAKLQELNTAGNPIYVIYQLATPTEEVITDTTLISQFEKLINGYTYEGLTYAEIQGLGILDIEYWTWYKGEKGEIELDDTKLDNLITEKMKMMYPIGSIILKMNNVNPSTYLGFGTWELIAQGRTLVGVNASDSDFNTVNKIGGAKTHKHWAGGYKANMNLNAIDNKIYIDAQYRKIKSRSKLSRNC